MTLTEVKNMLEAEFSHLTLLPGWRITFESGEVQGRLFVSGGGGKVMFATVMHGGDFDKAYRAFSPTQLTTPSVLVAQANDAIKRLQTGQPTVAVVSATPTTGPVFAGDYQKQLAEQRAREEAERRKRLEEDQKRRAQEERDRQEKIRKEQEAQRQAELLHNRMLIDSNTTDDKNFISTGGGGNSGSSGVKKPDAPGPGGDPRKRIESRQLLTVVPMPQSSQKWVWLGIAVIVLLFVFMK